MRLKKDFILWRFDLVDEVVDVVVRETFDVDVEADRVDVVDLGAGWTAVGAMSRVVSMLLRLESTFMSMSNAFVDGAIVCICVLCYVLWWCPRVLLSRSQDTAGVRR